VTNDSDTSSTIVVASDPSLLTVATALPPVVRVPPPPTATIAAPAYQPPSQTEINARNQVELHATTLKYIAMKRDSRPPNTQDAYGPR